jgi:5'-3' exonuclease
MYMYHARPYALRGVASWNWYYPHHYAPMASDLVDLDTINGGCE